MPSRRLRRSSSARTASAKRDPAAGRRCPGSRVGGLEPGLRVADGGARDGQRLGVGEHRVAGRRRRTRGGRGRRRPRRSRSSRSSTSRARASVSPATPSEPSTIEQNWWVVAMVARVEAGQRLGDPAVPQRRARRRRSRASSSIRSDCSTAGSAGSRGQRPLGLDQLGPDPLAQLLAGRAAERHDQHLLERRDALGDVAGDQGADGPGLAGAGAGLEQGGAGRQRVADVERTSITARATLSPPVEQRLPDPPGVRRPGRRRPAAGSGARVARRPGRGRRRRPRPGCRSWLLGSVVPLARGRLRG